MELINKLRLAIEQERDLVSLLDAERDHLRRCPDCRASIARLITAARGREAAMDLALARLEELGQLDEPPHYPRFDLSFLDQAQSFGTRSSAYLWNSSRVLLPSGMHQQVRQLAEVGLRVRVDARSMNASFVGLSEQLSSTVGPIHRPTRPDRPVGEGQSLTLPDPEEDLEIIVKVQAGEQGRSQLGIELRPLAGTAPLPQAEVQLHFLTGSETRRMRKGKVNFVDLDSGPYTFEIKPVSKGDSAQVWRFDIILESA